MTKLVLDFGDCPEAGFRPGTKCQLNPAAFPRHRLIALAMALLSQWTMTIWFLQYDK